MGLFSLEKALGRSHLIVTFQYLKGTTRKMGTPFSAGPVTTGQGKRVLNYKRVDLD